METGYDADVSGGALSLVIDISVEFLITQKGASLRPGQGYTGLLERNELRRIFKTQGFCDRK